MLRRDRDATIAQHFEDKRSYVAPDGREVLYGRDWKARKYVVWCRGNGRCEGLDWRFGINRWERCRNEMDEIHHIVRRSVKRDDRMTNLKGLCHTHHDVLEHRKPRWTKRSAA